MKSIVLLSTLLLSAPAFGGEAGDAACAILNHFGGAAPFNLFAYDNALHHQSDTEGRVAVGGGVSGLAASRFDSYRIGAVLAPGNAVSLLAGGPVSMTNGTIEPSNVIYGRFLPGLDLTVDVAGGYYAAPAGTEAFFRSALADAKAEALRLSRLPAQAAVTAAAPAIRLAATAADADGAIVFAIAPAVLAAGNDVHELAIDAPAGATVVVNVGGRSVALDRFGFVLTGGVAAENVLFNFYEADAVSFSAIGVQGSVLAPAANLAFVDGVVHGNVFVRSFAGAGGGWNDGQLNNVFASCPQAADTSALLRTLGWR